MTDRFCNCGCGESLAGMRKDAIWHSDACRKRGAAPQSAEKARNPASFGVGWCLLALTYGAILALATT